MAGGKGSGKGSGRGAGSKAGAVGEAVDADVAAGPKGPRRRTSAFSSHDPSVRERLGAPADAGTAKVPDGRIAGRFEFRARGAGMVVHDAETDRTVPFPKVASGAVQHVLAALFAPAGTEASHEDGAGAVEGDGLPKSYRDKRIGLTMRKVKVRVDPMHPTQVVRSRKGGDGLEVAAYAVTLDGFMHGHVLVTSPTRVQVNLPRLVHKITAHTSVAAAFDRVVLLCENYVRRNAPAAKAIAGPG